jgi:hypothetical protein
MPVTKVKSPKAGLKVTVATDAETNAATNPVVAESVVTPEATTAAPSLENREMFLRNFRQLCTLSDDGKKYADSILEYLQRPDSTNTKRVVKSVSFNDPIAGEGRAFIDVATSTCVLLLFTESYNDTSNVPITDRAPAIRNRIANGEIAEGEGKLKLIQMIIVDPVDYNRADRMATHIFNLFSAIENKGKYNVNLYKQLRLIPNFDVNAVKNFINRRSPHTVQDRVDWGVVMEIETGMERSPGYMIAEQPLRTPVLAIGGYTKFIMTQDTMGQKVYPICIISNITSDIPVSGILNFAIPIAASNAIVNGAWMGAYSTFKKGKANLGNFFLDQNKKPIDFTSAEQQQQSIISSFCQPVLGIDIPEGRAHIPELERLYNTHSESITYYVKDPITNQTVEKTENVTVADKFLLDSADKFFGGKFNEFKINGNGFVKPTAAIPWINYEGSFMASGNLTDTREYDYLNLVANLKMIDEKVIRLLGQSTDPSDRIRNLKDRVDENTCKITYRCTTILFNSTFVTVLANILSTQVAYISAPAMGSMSVPLNTYISQTMTPITGANAIFGGYSYHNPTANIYF